MGSSAGKRRLPVGGEVRRWRGDRHLTLAALAERSGLNIGYLSQIENDKASPSLESLAAIAGALDVPPAWLLLGDASAPGVIRAPDRTATQVAEGVRAERVDGGLSRGFSMLHVFAGPHLPTGAHAHVGEEHHLVLRGRWRMQQGDHEIEVGPGDYVVWDGMVPHDAEVIGDESGELLIVSRRVDAVT